MNKTPVSVVILTKNEEKRIRDCIKSALDWADEIIVVDDGSRDRTVEIAQSLGASVFVRKMDIEGKHRNWAYQKAHNSWVLSVDSDERLTVELKEEIKNLLLQDPKESAFAIPRKNFIGDYWIKGGGLYPASQIKLSRRDKFKWEEVEVHPRSITTGAQGHLKSDLIHYTYNNWGDFLGKLNRQTDLEALKWYKLSLENPRKARLKMNLIHALWRTLDRFVRTFIGKKGYRDGFIGFMIAYFASLYQIISYAKYRELQSRKGT